MKRFSRRELNSILRLIRANCDESGLWYNETLWNRCRDPRFVTALFALKDLNYIDLWTAADLPSAVLMKANGMFYPIERREIWLNRLYGFLSGVLVSVIAGTLLHIAL